MPLKPGSLCPACPSYLYNLLKRNAPLRSSDLLLSALALPLAPLAALLEACAEGLRRGGTIAVLATSSM